MPNYKPYPKYKESGVAWLGEVPEGWELSKLKFDSYIKARVGWHGLKSDELLEKGDAFVVTGSDFFKNTIDWKNCRKCTLDRYNQDKYIQLKDNDLLVTKDGTIGKIIKVNKLPQIATLNSGVFVIRPLTDNYLSEYYYWILISSIFHGFISYYKTGSTILHLYQATFEQMPYPLPPLKQQTKIANYLDQKTKTIDTLISKQQTLIELLKEKRQALISHVVTKGLDKNVPMKESGVANGWRNTPLKYKVSVIDGDRSSEYPNEKDYVAFGIPFLSSKNIVRSKLIDKNLRFISKDKFQKLGRGKLKHNDLIITVRGTIGNVAIFDTELIGFNTGFINAQMMIIRPIYIYFKFLFYITKSFSWTQQLDMSAYGATVKQLSNDIIGNMIIPLPPLTQQTQIANYLDEKTKKIDTLIDKSTQAIKLLKERRTALVSAVVTGKVDVREG